MLLLLLLGRIAALAGDSGQLLNTVCGLSVCLFVTYMSKRLNRFFLGLSRVGTRNHVSAGVQMPEWRGQILGLSAAIKNFMSWRIYDLRVNFCRTLPLVKFWTQAVCQMHAFCCVHLLHHMHVVFVCVFSFQ